MSESLIVREPVFIESNGQRVAVLLPIAVYESLLSGRTTSPGVPSSNASIDLENEALLREQRSFETMHSDLLARYPRDRKSVV